MADLTTQILIDIRDAARATNVRLDQTVERLDQTVERLDQTVERLDQTVERLDRLERRQVDAEIRISTELVTLTGVLRSFHDDFLAERPSRAVLADHERRLRALESPGS